MVPIRKRSLFPKTAGQSLIEVLVGVTVTGLIILSAGILLNVSSRGVLQSRELQDSTALAQELMENLISYADSKWYCAPAGCAATRGLYNLAKGENNKFYIAAATSPLEWRSGSETVVLNNRSYSRYFYLENVCRDGTGMITACPGVLADPSTQKAKVVVEWLTGGKKFDYKVENYLVRSRTAVIGQTDWSGGSYNDANATALLTADPAKYAWDNGNAEVSAPAGSIKAR